MEQKKPIDVRNVAKFLSGTGILGAIGVAFVIYLLPKLVAIVWQGVALVAGLTVLSVLILIVTSKKFWRILNVISEKVAKMFTFWLITWDEFILQEMEIKQAREDREVINKQANLLFGQVAEKDAELKEAKKKAEESKGLITQLMKEGRDESDAELQLYANEHARQNDFINTIFPLRNQLEDLAELCQKVYKNTDIKIRDAEAELKLQKDLLKSYTAGATAMDKALSIFKAENPDVLLAKQVVKEKIGQKIGSIRNTLDIINPIMNERALRDKVKVAGVLEQMRTLDITGIQTKKEEKYSHLLN